MHTAQVDREVVVDEYPDVIVTREAEGAATVVGEGRVNFRAEVVVVTQPLIAEALAVDREVAVELSKEYSPDEPVGVSEIVVPLMT